VEDAFPCKEEEEIGAIWAEYSHGIDIPSSNFKKILSNL
jgi:hypothetical protein